ncbi:MAG: L,D-transpeptidase family protein [Thermoleophilaceae bacterium]|nr:L,D-transpeptidase family protein [Thermoleophilaceae bacterium]
MIVETMLMLQQRKRVIVVGTLGLALIFVGAFGFEQLRKDRISSGVTAAGVDISGLQRFAAEAKLRSEVEEPLLEPVKVKYGGHKSTISAGGAGVSVDVSGMVDEAVTASHSGFFLFSAVRNAAGLNRNISVADRIDYSHRAVNNFVKRVARQQDQEVKDAKVTFSARGLGEVDGKVGVRVKQYRLRKAIIAAFTNPELSRSLKVPVKITQPKVRRKDLAAKYPTVVTIDRGGFKLRLFKNLKLKKTYRIAVGRAGLETPAGLYSITSRQDKPVWSVPKSDWAGKLAGKTIPFGDPRNPIKGRWLGLYGGVGIHGTSEPASIGSAASHGCIRMLIPDVIELYPSVPMGSPVYVG